MSGRNTVLHNSAEDGFSLIELLIVILILPLVVGAIAVALVSVFSLQGSTANRVANASDAQVVSTNFEQDVHAAVNLTTQLTASCGSGTQLLGLEWGADAKFPGGFQFVVSYVRIQTGTTYSLVRQFCSAGPSITPTSIITVSYDVTSLQAAPTISDANPSIDPTQWISSAGVTGVKFVISEPASTFSYTLVAVPGASASSNSLPTVAAPTDSCGLATPGTGTYASSLCFVDFTSYSEAEQANPANGNCQEITSAIENTSDTLSFCLAVTSTNSYPANATTTTSCAAVSTPPGYGPVCAATIPTYYDAPTSEAYLGNNGFYTGIPGRPALYESTTRATTTLSFSGIKVSDSGGNAITGWEFVTGDAESTDSNESLTWTMDSSNNLSLLPDSPGGTQIDDIGNACPYTSNVSGSYDNWSNTYLTINGPTAVCKAGSAIIDSSDKTGTVMLDTTATTTTPMTMNVTMVGAGLQAIFVGVMLP